MFMIQTANFEVVLIIFAGPKYVQSASQFIYYHDCFAVFIDCKQQHGQEN